MKKNKRIKKCKECLALPLPLYTRLYVMYVTGWAEKVYRQARRKYINDPGRRI
jgi:hypothetical protein